MANVARLDNKQTNIRFNEVYLGLFVIADAALAEQWGAVTAAEFAGIYEQILMRTDVEGRRVVVERKEDLGELRLG
jgi:hypothetical protein